MKALIDANADINLQDTKGFTAVMRAAQVLCVIVYVDKVQMYFNIPLVITRDTRSPTSCYIFFTVVGKRGPVKYLL